MLNATLVILVYLGFCVSAWAATSPIISSSDELAKVVLRQRCSYCQDMPGLLKTQSFKNYGIHVFIEGDGGYGTFAAITRRQPGGLILIKILEGFGANGEVLQVNPKTIDGSDYLEVYAATSKGNGDVQLFELRGNNIKLVFRARGVDQHQDEDEFEDGIIQASYQDINHDGHFDIVLNATVILYPENPNRRQKKPCTRVFLWNRSFGKFQEDKEAAINRQLCADKWEK
jgi:hypothetical protein